MKANSRTDASSWSYLHIEDLLKPCQFDWAEDTETNVDFSATEGSGFPVPTVSCNQNSDELDSSSGSSLFDTPFSSSEHAIDTSAEVRDEFSFRRFCMDVNRHNTSKIHHFNWLGCPVYEYSSTPPAISLLFLTSKPKTPVSSDEWRIRAILGSAMVFIDPVIVYLDECRGREKLARKGFDLVRFATGRVYKFYSKHGHWIDDDTNWGDNTAVDVGNIQSYESPHEAISNGFVQHNTIRSREQWVQEREENYDASKAIHQQKVILRMRNKQRRPSPLRYSTSANDLNRRTARTNNDRSNCADGSATSETIEEEDEVSDEVPRPAREFTRLPSCSPVTEEEALHTSPSSNNSLVVPKAETIKDDKQTMIPTSQEIGWRRPKRHFIFSFTTAASGASKRIQRKCKRATFRMSREVHTGKISKEK